jgi:metal-dependent amidase/aminoacylase/carboxypeptidase family protein
MGLYIRQNSEEDLQKAVERVKECAKGVAKLTHTEVSFHKFAPTYESEITNVPLAKHFKDSFEELNIPIIEATPNINPGTSDFGNVSRVTPSTSANIKIGEGFRGHTPEFAKAAASEKGHEATMIGAKAMALLATKLFLNSELLSEAKKFFEKRKEDLNF